MSAGPRGVVRRSVGVAAWTAVTLLVAAGVLVAVGLPSAKHAASQVYPEPAVLPAAAVSMASERAPEFRPDRPTVAILLAAEGTNVADSLAPYEVFARSGAVNVFLVAEKSEPITLGGGLTVLPQHTFAEIDTMTGGGPDVVVVPQLHGNIDDEMRWVTQVFEREPESTVMSVCVGAEYLADAGLLDGRRATAHWLKLIGLRRDHRQVDWVDDVRFVEDGRIMTTAGVLAGIDGAMRVLERLGAGDQLRRIADEIHWNGYGSGAPVEIDAAGPGPADLPFALSAAYRWDRPHHNVLVTDGVGEIELASTYRPYTELSWLATMTTTTVDGQPVVSQHGVTVVPETAADEAGQVDRLLVPGGEAARTRIAEAAPSGPDPTYLHSGDRFAFDPVIDDIAVHYDRATATWVAKSLQYPVDDPGSGRDGVSSWPWAQTAIAAALVAAAIGLVQLSRVTIGAVRRRGRRS
ncbi:DJ-1/PfpI family protein [Gordonia metallireducens]|uniref:DJ-1/PfpI family protein n=1 Tax=Gordonia metallireducens TaxID=2897779 RepID=UPI001E492D3B|nr:DJ-1/PfpI family protein [Gordonia metallireducens]